MGPRTICTSCLPYRRADSSGRNRRGPFVSRCLMSSICAIETTYKGYRFRSRLEARWAVFFDALEIPWEYEVQGYSTPLGNYLPDFVLWRTSYAEVKPADGLRLSPTALGKMRSFVNSTGLSLILLDGMPECVCYAVLRTDNQAEWIDLGASATKGQPCSYCQGQQSPTVAFDGRIRDAVNAARSARFEYGTSGATPPAVDHREAFRMAVIATRKRNAEGGAVGPQKSR